MKYLLIIIGFLILLCLENSCSNNTNTTDAIVIKQYTSHGDRYHYCIIGYDSSWTFHFQNKEYAQDEIFLNTIIVNRNTIGKLSNYITNNCQNKLNENNPSVYYYIQIIAGSDTLRCHITDNLKQYFMEMQKVIDTAGDQIDTKPLLKELKSYMR